MRDDRVIILLVGIMVLLMILTIVAGIIVGDLHQICDALHGTGCVG